MKDFQKLGLLLFLFLIFLINFVIADQETIFVHGGDKESITPNWEDSQSASFIATLSGTSPAPAPATPGATVSPGGGGTTKETIKPECSIDSECQQDYVCSNNKCVKLFDIKIVNFNSPVKLGEFFDFTYFVKGMANISSDVTLDFWIANASGKKITSGSDVIYIGNFEEKTETTKIFLPSDVESGIYEFYVQVSYGSYVVSSHRTIELEVREGVATLGAVEPAGEINIPTSLIVIIIILLLLISGGRLQKNKREKRSTELGNLIKVFEKDIGKKVSNKKIKFNKKKEILSKESELKKKPIEEPLYKSDFKYSEQKETEKPQELIEKVVEETKRKNRGRKTSEEFIDELKKKDEQKGDKPEKKEQTDDEFYESLFKE